MTMPLRPKIYHIVHVDRLKSIIASKILWCDAEMAKRAKTGTEIGMSSIKARRLNELTLTSQPGLFVGQCVPFYFCPRSIMLYVIHQANHSELAYKGGQSEIVHLEFDLYSAVEWAGANGRRWAFTLSNAGSRYFEDRSDLAQLDEIDWDAVKATNWVKCKDGKQAEFLVEGNFPWELIERVGTCNNATYRQAAHALATSAHKPKLEVRAEWYY